MVIDVKNGKPFPDFTEAEVVKNTDAILVHDGNGVKKATIGQVSDRIRANLLHNIPRIVPKDIT